MVPLEAQFGILYEENRFLIVLSGVLSLAVEGIQTGSLITHLDYCSGGLAPGISDL